MGPFVFGSRGLRATLLRTGCSAQLYTAEYRLTELEKAQVSSNCHFWLLALGPFVQMAHDREILAARTVKHRLMRSVLSAQKGSYYCTRGLWPMVRCYGFGV